MTAPTAPATPALQLQGGCVVITGGGGLLGRGLAHAFAARGAGVVLADRNLSAAQAVADDVASAHGVRTLAVETDVSDRASTDALARTVFDAFGAVSVVCNNAGIAIVKDVLDQTPEDWATVLGIQLQGVLNGTYSFLPGLLEQPQRSHIVNTSSMSGVGRADLRTRNAPYVTAKFAVVGLSETMRPALADRNVGVSVLCPGFTRADPENVTVFPLPSSDWYRDNILSADQVGEETVLGVLEDRLHIFPHRAGLQEVLDRHELLLRGFEQAARTSPPLRRPAEPAATT